MALAERLTDVLRAECASQDLRKGTWGVHVMAMRQDGSLYEVGHVSDALIWHDLTAAHAAINRIKFFAQPKDTP